MHPSLALDRRWLDTWNGIGLVSAGHRAGWDLQLTQYGTGHWRATFRVTGFAHSITGGSAYELEPWRAVQRAAWGVLKGPGPSTGWQQTDNSRSIRST